jgi:hypothetical protein
LEPFRSTSADLVVPQLVADDDSQGGDLSQHAPEMVLVEGAILMRRIWRERMEIDPPTARSTWWCATIRT